MIMNGTLEVSFTPADFAALEERDLSETVCIVFDVLRATTSIITALANGARVIFPVAEISEALLMRDQFPDLLLAGERDGVRILSELTGSVPFDLGNSPREFTARKIKGRSIVMTTTNGTRALRACSRAWTILAASFLNLRATADLLEREPPRHLALVCSGTFEQAAYEDVLAAGALCDLLWKNYDEASIADSAQLALQIYKLERANLSDAMLRSRNGRRLLANAELCGDVPFSLQHDKFPIIAELGPDGGVRQRFPSV
jgi:2-phosphosulfolactate phosphatase